MDVMTEVRRAPPAWLRRAELRRMIAERGWTEQVEAAAIDRVSRWPYSAIFELEEHLVCIR